MSTEFSQSDVKVVLKNYAEKCSTTFSSFLDVWKSLKCFRLIQVFREKKDEVGPDHFLPRLNVEVLNGLIPAIVEYLEETHSEYYRIGAVYFVYAIYMNQPQSAESVKINLTPDLHRSVVKLHQELKDSKQTEACFALTTLFSNRAFSLSMDIRRKSLRISNVHMHQRALTEFVHEDHEVFAVAVGQFKTKRIQNIAVTYHQSKETLSLPGCVLKPSRLHSQLSNLLPEYIKWQNRQTHSSAVHGSSVASDLQREECQAQLEEQRRHLKRRSLITQAFEAEAGKGKRRKTKSRPARNSISSLTVSTRQTRTSPQKKT